MAPKISHRQAKPNGKGNFVGLSSDVFAASDDMAVAQCGHHVPVLCCDADPSSIES